MRVERTLFVLVFFVLFIPILSSTVVLAEKGGAPAIVRGHLLTSEGLPLSRARVAIFRKTSICPPTVKDANRVPLAVAWTGSGGGFLFAISAGSYFLGGTGASSRANNAMLLDSENFFLAMDEK